MNYKKVVIIHFGELWLKGRNRPNFIRQLYKNIENALGGSDYNEFESWRDRFVIYLNEKSDADFILKKLGYVFGISWFSIAYLTDSNIENMMNTVNSLLSNYDPEISYKIEAHRTDKSLAFNSYQIVSAFIKQDKIKVSKDSSHIIYINPTNKGTFIYFGDEINKGLGGFPVGVSGKAIILFSGGIDSPVAAYYAMKKGLEPIYVHVHSFDDNKKAEKSKIPELINQLSNFNNGSKAYYIPSSIFQISILKVKHSFEIILFKRFIYSIGEMIAKKEKADVIVTGESLGQVSSQTVSNLISTSYKIKNEFVMRPLIAFDKSEIIKKAKEIGTFDISIKPYKDVCSMHSRDAITNSSNAKLDELSKLIEMDDIVIRSLLKSDSLSYD